jgi:predicted dehydrogenase
MIGHVRRFDSAYVEAKRLIGAGALIDEGVRDEAKPPLSTEDGRATITVSLAATPSIREGRPVDVEVARPETMARKKSGLPFSD